MKTSNKILLGLVIVVFAVPFLLAVNLKSKIKKGEYTIQKHEQGTSSPVRKGSFTPFKVVKVTAPDPEMLSCHLKLSDKMDYEYYLDGKDSATVFTRNDTLYISYAAKENPTGEEKRYNNVITLRVNLPLFDNLVIDGAEVIIDSLPASPNFSLTLKNNGVIKDGSERKIHESTKVTQPVTAAKEPIAQMSAAPAPKSVGEKKKNKSFHAGESNLFNVDTKYQLTYSLLDRI